MIYMKYQAGRWGAGWWDSSWHTCLKDELWIILASQSFLVWDLGGSTKSGTKKCVISYIGNHLKPKKNPVCSGSEHKQREKVQSRNQRVRAGREDSHLDKRLWRTIREEGPDWAKEKLWREGRSTITLHTCARTFDEDRKSTFHVHLWEECK